MGLSLPLLNQGTRICLCEKVRFKPILEGEDGIRWQGSGVRGGVRRRVLGCESS